MKQGVFWPEKVEEFEKQTPLENLDCETVTHDNRKETEQHNEVVGTLMFWQLNLIMRRFFKRQVCFTDCF